jgi:uncharacterized OB-fold protein
MTQQSQELPPIPPPVPQPESDFYWQKCKEHELWLRHCNACDTSYFYPRDICPECFSRNTEWIHCSGRGTLHTFCIAHRGPTPAFRDRSPYVCAIVELEEGARMPTSLVDVKPDPASINVGMALEVVFDDLNENISLPKFRPAN